jgi:sn-glycerol 3-phosphate transport system permease protein
MTVIDPEVEAVTVEQADHRPVRVPSGRLREALTGYAFLAPCLLVFAVFSYYAFGRLIWLSTHQQNATGTAERARPGQLWEVLTSDLFTGALRTTLAFLVYTIPLGLILGTLLAVAAHRRLKGIRIFQTIFSSTVASSTAVASVIFFVLLNPAVGYFSNVSAFSLSDPSTALRGVALSSIWQNLGLTFIIVLAGLQAVPDELNEAATLDGFGPFRRFFKVTVPLISPTLLFLVVVLAIFGMQAYAQVDILTSGGPNHATETLVWRIVHNSGAADVGKGAALSIGLFVVTLVITVVQFTILERRVHYGR